MNPTAKLKVRHKPDCPGMLEKDINGCTCNPPLCEFRNCNNCETYQPDYNGIPMADGCQCIIPETGELPKWQPSEPYMVHLVNFVHMVRGVAIGDLGRTQPPPENTAEELYADISGFLSDPWNTDIYEYPLRNAVFEGQRIWFNSRKIFVDQWKQMKQGLNDWDICGKCGSRMNREVWCNKCRPEHTDESEKAFSPCCHPDCNKSGIIQILLDASPDGYTFSCFEHVEDLKEDGKKNEVLYPNITKEIKFGVDGDQVCVLWGPNLQEGISGFGTTLEDALKNFARDFARNGINTWPWPDWAKGKESQTPEPEDGVITFENKGYIKVLPASKDALRGAQEDDADDKSPKELLLSKTTD